MNILERCLDKWGDLYSYKSSYRKISNRQKRGSDCKRYGRANIKKYINHDG